MGGGQSDSRGRLDCRRGMGKKKQALSLDARAWRGLVDSLAALQPLLETR